MRRREFLGSTVAFGTCTWAGAPGLTADRVVDWTSLRRVVGERLISVQSPIIEARQSRSRAAALFRQLKNPYWIGDEAGLTQTLGWIGAWTSQPSLMAVAARGPEDVAAAIRFSVSNRIPLIVKGGGHSYFGNSNRADSLLVWTRRLRTIVVHDAFRPQGAPAALGIPAVSVGAGTLWGEVYRTVSRDHGRYVQGGGCMTVGTAGFVQGGGFGSFSKQFGTGAANLLEAEMVMADGRIRTVNAWQDPELFFAIRGGGGGTFGVVTRLTLRTYPLPASFGAVMFKLTAADATTWQALVARMMLFYRDKLHRPEWGEQIGFSPGRRLSVSMLCHSLNDEQIRAIWAPLFAWIGDQGRSLKFEQEPQVISLEGRQLWNPAFLRKVPGITITDDRPGADPDNIFWVTNLGEVGQVLNAYQSRWIAASWLRPDRTTRLVDALVAASSEWSITLHTNKGLAGGAADAIARTRETAMNPDVTEAFALLVCAADAPPAYPGISGFEPDIPAGRVEAAQVSRAMAPIIALDPGAGSYVSEADYFEPDWQRSHWGSNYPRLMAAKLRYDPTGLFSGHHTIGT
jgi:FAD binding domain/Berberine and berberine like